MKRLFTLTFPLLALMTATLACSFFSTGTEPAPATELPLTAPPTLAGQPSTTPLLPTDTPASLPTETPPPSLTNTSANTQTSPPSPTSTPSSTPSPDMTRIRFATGGTWTDVVGAGQANMDTTFVLAAAEGQVMGVSVFEGPGYYLTITGADGTLLTPPNSDDYFWRGTLPATQDYFVSVQAPHEGDFTLRVAINPPGQSEQSFEYSNDGVNLEYSDAFAPVVYPYNFLQRENSSLALTVLDQKFYDKTNLGEAFFVLNLFTSPDAVTNCYEPYYEGEQAEGQATFNGITFEKSTGIGVGAGNIYEQIIYRTLQNGACMEVVFFMHSSNIGNYTPGTVMEFDREGLLQMFEEVLGTLTVE